MPQQRFRVAHGQVKHCNSKGLMAFAHLSQSSLSSVPQECIATAAADPPGAAAADRPGVAVAGPPGAAAADPPAAAAAAATAAVADPPRSRGRKPGSKAMQVISYIEPSLPNS